MKKIRLVISVLIFLFLIYIIVSENKVLGGLEISLFQYFPSIIRDMKNELLVFSGVIIISIITILFGRIYCSFLCPLGIFQDIILFFRKKYNTENSLKKYARVVRIPILIVTFFTIVAGGMAMINILEPFSIFGRMATNLLKPFFVFMNNIVSQILQKRDIYSINEIPYHTIGTVVFIVTISYLTLIVFAVIFGGRIYCNSICPVGTMIGLLSKISLFKIYLDKSKCLSCGACERKCKGNCIDLKRMKVIGEECLMCFNCIDVCPKKGIKYGIEKKKEEEVNDQRREFLTGMFGAAAGIAGITGVKVFGSTNNSILKGNGDIPLTPPGSGSVKHYQDLCTGCQLCVNKCPSKIITPAIFKYGIEGFMQPYIEFSKGFCQYECTICSEVCPAGAIKPITKEDKKITQIGIVQLNKAECIVYKEKRDCGACSEHCPTKAVYMVENPENYRSPEINQSICIGCGACEYICPAKPIKAITIKPNEVHQKALKKEDKKEEGNRTPLVNKEEFPF